MAGSYGMSQFEAVEVLVMWGERILNAHTFQPTQNVFLGSGAGDLYLPGVVGRRPLLRMGSYIGLSVAPESRAEAVGAEGTRFLAAGEHTLRAGESVRMGLPGSELSLRLRRVPRVNSASAGALVDFSSTEAMGILLALFVTVLLAMYSTVFRPLLARVDKEREEIKLFPRVSIRFTQPLSRPEANAEMSKRLVVQPNDASTARAPRARTSPVPTPRTALALQAASRPQAASAPRLRSRATTDNLLTTFQSGHTQRALNRLAESSTGIERLAGQATGRTGQAQSESISGHLKDVGGGADSTTVGIGNASAPRGAPGYTHLGGSSGRTRVQISAGREGEAFSGQIDREAIRRVIREHLGEIRSCYERELQSAPDLFGKLVLQWDVTDGGRVSDGRVKSNSLGNERVAECILSRLSTWQFPAPPANQIGRVAYPFVFSSR